MTRNKRSRGGLESAEGCGVENAHDVSSIALSDQVAGRIDAAKPVAQIISEIFEEFEATMAEMSGKYVRAEA